MLFIKQTSLAVLAVVALSMAQQADAALTCVACPNGNCAGQSLATACRSGVCYNGACLGFNGKRDGDGDGKGELPEARNELEAAGADGEGLERRANTWCLLWDDNDRDGKNVRSCAGCNSQNAENIICTKS